MENEQKDANLSSGEAETKVETEVKSEVETKESEAIEELPQETLEARRSRLERQLKQVNKKLGVSEEKVETKNKAGKKSDELGYGEKAFLIANGIKGTREVELVKNIMEDTGKTLDEVIESKYFQSEIKELRESLATREAIPSASKRSSTSARDSVDYWVAKGELPPADQVSLRRQVIDARIKSATEGSKFTSQSVIGKL